MPERKTRNLFEQDKKYAHDLIDNSFIGEFLGEGLRMRVYGLSEDFTYSAVKGKLHNPKLNVESVTNIPQKGMVVKIPKSESLFHPSMPDRKLDKLNLGFTYFEPYIVNPTYLVESENSYCLLQRRLNNFSPVTPDNMELVEGQLRDFFTRHRQMVSDGMYLDVLGRDGLVACSKALYSKKTLPMMTNLVIEHRPEGDQLQVPDITVMHIGKQFYLKDALSQAKRAVRLSGYKVNENLIKQFFGIEYGRMHSGE